MLRLLFKVHSVHLKLREDVQIQVAIRKDQQNLLIPHKAKLINGTATLNAHAQFFICKSNPKFTIIVMILHHSGKKLGGICQINPKQWEQSSNNKTTSLLQKSADPSAVINFDFMYLECNLPACDKKLIGLGELQSKRKSQIMKSMENKFSNLANQNCRLSNEVAFFKKQNRQLIQHQKEMESEYSKNYNDFQQQLKFKSEQILDSEKNLHRMKQTIQKIQQMVNTYGQHQLKQKVEDFLSLQKIFQHQGHKLGCKPEEINKMQ